VLDRRFELRASPTETIAGVEQAIDHRPVARPFLDFVEHTAIGVDGAISLLVDKRVVGRIGQPTTSATRSAIRPRPPSPLWAPLRQRVAVFSLHDAEQIRQLGDVAGDPPSLTLGRKPLRPSPGHNRPHCLVCRLGFFLSLEGEVGQRSSVNTNDVETIIEVVTSASDRIDLAEGIDIHEQTRARTSWTIA
jgi:hypothetical protein